MVSAVWFEKKEIASARAFLDVLRPTSELWAEKPLSWIFRGLRDAEWNLLPSAHRPKSWEPFRTPGEPQGFDPKAPFSSIVQDDMEREILRRFFRHLDKAGLAVPGQWENVERELLSSDEGGWPTKALLPFIALAQHHGIPTRLLDWTRRGRNAAYFAAADAVASEEKAPNIAVWALDAAYLGRCEGTESYEGITLHLATAPQASNPNLRAQEGLFTFCRGDVTDGQVWSQNRIIDGLIQNEALERQGVAKRRGPVLRKLTLARDQAPELLRRLAEDGVTAATMFPGRDGVVTSLREQRFWDCLDDGGV